MLTKENIALYAFRKFGDTALQAAFCCTGNREDAEDIAQEVFLSLHQKPRDFTSDAHLKAFLLRAVINRAKNLHKSVWRRLRVDLDDVPETKLAAEDSGNAEEILKMIQEMPQPYSAVVYLHDCEGYTIREIAEMLGKNTNTVSSLLQRGHKRLRMEINGEEERK